MHETIVTALEQICNDFSLSTRRSNIPSVEKSNGKLGRGDFVVKDAQLGGFQHLVIDVVCTHEFVGSHLADVMQARPNVYTSRSPCRVS